MIFEEAIELHRKCYGQPVDDNGSTCIGCPLNSVAIEIFSFQMDICDLLADLEVELRGLQVNTKGDLDANFLAN